MRNQNPKEITLKLAKKEPLMRYKGEEDFFEWQKKARAKLRELLGLDFMQSCESDFKIISEKDCGSYNDTYFSFQSEPGYYVPCHILTPKNYEGKLTTVICLQGHSTGMHISIGEPKYEGDEKTIAGGDRDYARRLAERGRCAVAVEQRYMGECGGNENGPGCLAHGEEGTAGALPTLMFGRCAAGERVWDISRAIDVVFENFPQVNPDDIMCTGNSGGGTSTFYVSCIDERIKLAAPSCAVCTYLDSIINLYHCPCNYIPQIARYFDMGDLSGLIAPRGLVVIAGKDDPIFPISGVKATFEITKSLYKAAGAENKAELFIGDGGHRYYADGAFKTIDKIRNL